MNNKTFEKCEVCGNAVDVSAHKEIVVRNASGNLVMFLNFLTMTIWHAVLVHMVGGGFLLWFVWFLAQSFAWLNFGFALTRRGETTLSEKTK